MRFAAGPYCERDFPLQAILIKEFRPDHYKPSQKKIFGGTSPPEPPIYAMTQACEKILTDWNVTKTWCRGSQPLMSGVIKLPWAEPHEISVLLLILRPLLKHIRLLGRPDKPRYIFLWAGRISFVFITSLPRIDIIWIPFLNSWYWGLVTAFGGRRKFPLGVGQPTFTLQVYLQGTPGLYFYTTRL